MSTLEVSLKLEDDAFNALVARIVAEVKQQLGAKPRDKWISPEEAMAMLRISSKTTLQRLRDERKIGYTQPEARVILYDADSIEDYLEKHSKRPF